MNQNKIEELYEELKIYNSHKNTFLPNWNAESDRHSNYTDEQREKSILTLFNSVPYLLEEIEKLQEVLKNIVEYEAGAFYDQSNGGTIECEACHMMKSIASEALKENESSSWRIKTKSGTIKAGHG